MNEVIILGCFLFNEGIQVDPNKIANIKRVLVPKKQKDVRRFPGLAR